MAEKAALIAILVIGSVNCDGRWSRQINSDYSPAAINDWIPLTQPCPTCRTNEQLPSRTNHARVLNFQGTQNQLQFQPQSFLPPPQASPQVQQNLISTQPQQFSLVGEPFSPQRFVLHQQQQQQQQPLTQFQGPPQHRPQHMQLHVLPPQQQQQPQMQYSQQPLLHHAIPPPQRLAQDNFVTPFVQLSQQDQNQFHYQHIPHGEQQLKPQYHFLPPPPSPQQQPQIIKQQQQQHNLNNQNNYRTQQQVNITPQREEKKIEEHKNKITEQSQPQPQLNSTPQPQQDEEIQLLYVPLETLYQQQQKHQQQQNQIPGNQYQNHRFNPFPPPVNPSQINEFYTIPQKSNPPQNNQVLRRPTVPLSTSPPLTTAATTTTTQRPTISVTQRAEYFRQQELQQTTPKPKPKSHQPPLAMFMLNDDNRASVTDVLHVLKNANSIAVVDAPTTKTPKIFIGPYGLEAPKGYSKFDLPYLSSIDHNRYERRVENLPFFVAPQSFRPPNGFSKIPLPAPHVGSVLVKNPPQEFFSPTPVPTTPASVRPTAVRYVYNPTPTPQISTPSDPFHFNPVAMTEHSTTDGNQNYYFTSSENPPQAPQTSTTPLPRLPEEERIRFNGEHRHPSKTYAQLQQPQEESPELYRTHKPTTYQSPRPIQSNRAQEEHRMKTYFKEQEAFKNRPKYQFLASSTTKEPEPEIDVEPAVVTTEAPPVYFSRPTSETFYNHRPSSYDEINENHELPVERPVKNSLVLTPKPAITRENSDASRYNNDEQQHRGQKEHSNHNFNFVQSVRQHTEEEPTSSPTQAPYSVEDSVQTQYPSFYHESEKIYRHDKQKVIEKPQSYYVTSEQSKETQQYFEVPEITPNAYHDTSPVMPQLSANLPGMVNLLMDMTENEHEIEQSTSPPPTTTTPPAHRRAPSRGRRPIPPRTTNPIPTSSPSYETTTRKIVLRTRRPLHPSRTSAAYTSSSDEGSTSRIPSSRNPNRVRYNPSNEERQQFKNRNKSRFNNNKSKEEENNLEYQRDVLNQNYPVIKPLNNQAQYQTTILPEKVDAHSINTEQPLYHTSQYSGRNSHYPHDNDVNHISTSTEQIQGEHFNGLKEPMRIPENQMEQKSEFVNEYNPPVYYDESPKISEAPTQIYKTSPAEDYPRERPVYVPTSTTSTTTPLPPTTTEFIPTTIESYRIRRPSIGRRPNRPTFTTTISPASSSFATETYETHDRFTTRSRTRQDSQSPTTRVVKFRTRVRKPLTTTPPPTNDGDDQNTNDNYYNTEVPIQKTSKRGNNQSTYKPNKFRTNQRSRFALETQESQWSPALSLNSFQPFDSELDTKGKSLDLNINQDAQKDTAPEIVTAGAFQEESYLVAVTPGPGPSLIAFDSKMKDESTNITQVFPAERKSLQTTESINATKPVTFADMLEEFMSDFNKNGKSRNIDVTENENVTAPTATPATKNEITNEVKSDEINTGRRRGVWRRVRVRPVDGLEVAESQNIGTQFLNVIASPNKDFGERLEKIEKKDLSKMYPIMEEVKDIDQPTIIPTSSNPALETTTPLLTTESTNTELSPVITRKIEEIMMKSDGDSTIWSTTEIPIQTTEETTGTSDHIITDAPTTSITYIEDETVMNQDEDYVTTTLQPQSIFDEVKRKLSDLFAMTPDEEDSETETDKLELYKPKYTEIQRTKILNDEMKETTTLENLPEQPSITEVPLFPKDFMGNLIYATSTSTEVSHETEICYRGRCVKTEDKKKIIR